MEQLVHDRRGELRAADARNRVDDRRACPLEQVIKEPAEESGPRLDGPDGDVAAFARVGVRNVTDTPTEVERSATQLSDELAMGVAEDRSDLVVWRRLPKRRGRKPGGTHQPFAFVRPFVFVRATELSRFELPADAVRNRLLLIDGELIPDLVDHL